MTLQRCSSSALQVCGLRQRRAESLNRHGCFARIGLQQHVRRVEHVRFTIPDAFSQFVSKTLPDQPVASAGQTQRWASDLVKAIRFVDAQFLPRALHPKQRP